MISSATLFLATLALHFTVVLSAPISVPVGELAPRALDNSAMSVRFARDESFPEVVPAFVKRAITDAFPIVKRETEDIVRRFPRRFIYEHLEKRGTTVHEKVTVIEKTVKHDTPADTVAFNNGQPFNNNGNNNGAPGGFTTSIGFSTTIAVPGVPTPTATSTSSAPAAPTPTPTGAPGPAPPANGPPVPDAPTPDAPAPPGDTTNDGTDPAAPKPDAPKPDAPAPPPATTTTDGTNSATPGPDGTTTTTDGAKPSDVPAVPSPDDTTTTSDPPPPPPPPTGGDSDAGADPNAQPSRRELGKSGAAWASSLRRRAAI